MLSNKPLTASCTATLILDSDDDDDDWEDGIDPITYSMLGTMQPSIQIVRDNKPQ